MLENIFGGTNVIDDGMKLVDKAFYTDQEKAEMKKELLAAYQPFKLVQRLLAGIVAAAFVGIVFIQVLLIIAGNWDAKFVEIAMQINSLESVSMLGWAFMAVMSLYFTGGVMSAFSGLKK